MILPVRRSDSEAPARPLTVRELLDEQSNRAPDSPAILALDQAPLTYAQLYTLVCETAEQLTSFGIGRNDRVAIVLPNGPEMATTFLAVAAGATCAPLNPAYRDSDLDFYLKDLNADALIISSELDSPARAVAARHGISTIELTARTDAAAGLFDLAGNPGQPPTRGGMAQPDDQALVLHTSGTTSRPKIVPLTHGNICTSAHNIGSTLGLTDADRCLNVMPLFHIHGLIGATLSSLSVGASLVCTPGFDAALFFRWLDDFSPTWYSAVPTMHQAVLAGTATNRAAIGRAKLRLIRSSSSSLPPVVMEALEQTFRVPVIESYGMTEASHQMTSNALPPGHRKPGSVGQAAGPEVSIMDESGTQLRNGETGEIVIRGLNVTLGYEGNPEANAAAYTDGWFRTGDQGHLDSDDCLFITGRLKEMINRGGENIAPREIDEALLDHPSVAQAVTFAVPHPTLGEDVVAAVVPHEHLATSEQELRYFAFDRLTGFKVPSQILIVDRIPKGPTGKLQRIGLADKLKTELTATYVAPTGQLEEALAEIWADTLELDRVGIDDNFFTSGGDSLLAASLFDQLEQFTNGSLPLAILFRAPTIRQLAEVIRRKSWVEAWSSLVPIEPEGSKPPFFCVHAHGGNVIGYRELARQLGADQPFYGLQAEDLRNGQQTTARSIEDMASHYVEEIRTVQPVGPYFLGGWCMGGTIAYEMAQQLQDAGQDVGLVAMIQSAHPDYPSYPAESTRFHRLAYSIMNRVGMERSNFSEVAREAKVEYSIDRTEQVLTWTRVRAEVMLTNLLSRLGFRFKNSNAFHLRSIETANNDSSHEYKPRPYRGHVAIFPVAIQPLGIEPDPTLGWNDLLWGDLRIEEIPGHRLAMLTEPRVRIVANRLRQCLDEANSRVNGPIR